MSETEAAGKIEALMTTIERRDRVNKEVGEDDERLAKQYESLFNDLMSYVSNEEDLGLDAHNSLVNALYGSSSLNDQNYDLDDFKEDFLGGKTY